MRAKNPTRKQKEIISNNGLVADTWNVIREDDENLYIISKNGVKRKISKSTKKKKSKRG